MLKLFVIATDRVELTWSMVRAPESTVLADPEESLGRLVLRLLRAGASFGPKTWRAAPAAAVSGAHVHAGPLLYEQCDYRVTLRADGNRSVMLQHRDPNVLTHFDDEELARFDGFINFRSQIGISTFRVLIDGQPEFEFDVEVFPTKLDYQTDYLEILADVQGTLSGLAFEYLRATWQGATVVNAPAPTQIEWLTLMRGIVEDLERSLRHIDRRPVRGLRREPVARRAEQVRRVDNSIRKFVRRAAERGRGTEVVPGIPVPERITERRAEPTLDTPEHRWLASQVCRIRRRIIELQSVERERTDNRESKRREKVLAELEQLKVRTDRWSSLDPLRAATDLPPPSFASLQLLTSPGYREAYRACMTLTLGLRLEGGPLQLSVKDLNLLYEYWCYLALLRLVRVLTPALFETESKGDSRVP